MWERLQRPTELALEPPARWPQEVLALWQMGLVYLFDGGCEISPQTRISGRRVVLRGSHLGDFGLLMGDDVLVVDSLLKSHYSVEGPVALLRSTFASHVQLGPWVRAEDAVIAEFVKLRQGVDVRSAGLSAFTAAAGRGNRPDHYPFSAELRDAGGVVVGARAWVGQHVSLLPGARVGAGTVVASGTTLFNDVGEHVFVSGAPARAMPIDFNLRALTPDEAYATGKAQGAAATALPVYGKARVAFREPRVLELDYPEHGVLRGLAQDNLLEFQRGALEAALDWLCPLYGPARAAYRRGASIRFEVTFPHPVPAHQTLARTLRLEARSTPAPGSLSADEARLLEALSSGPATVAELTRVLSLAALDDGRRPPPAAEPLLALSRRGLIHPPLLPDAPDVNHIFVGVVATLSPALRHEGPAQPLPPFVERVSSPGQNAVAPRPGPQAPASAGGDEIQVFLLEALRQLTSLEGKPIGVNERFVRLGLSSLSLSKLGAQIEDRFDIESPDLFAHDSIAALSSAILAALAARPTTQ